MHSLVVNDETNFLKLITPWLDNSCQIKPKHAITIFSQIFREINTPQARAEQAGTECGTNKVLLVVTHRLKDGDATEKLAEALTPALILI